MNKKESYDIDELMNKSDELMNETLESDLLEGKR